MTFPHWGSETGVKYFPYPFVLRLFIATPPASGFCFPLSLFALAGTAFTFEEQVGGVAGGAGSISCKTDVQSRSPLEESGRVAVSIVSGIRATPAARWEEPVNILNKFSNYNFFGIAIFCGKILLKCVCVFVSQVDMPQGSGL